MFLRPFSVAGLGAAIVDGSSDWALGKSRVHCLKLIDLSSTQDIVSSQDVRSDPGNAGILPATARMAALPDA
jgi:hypothetical protein